MFQVTKTIGNVLPGALLATLDSILTKIEIDLGIAVEANPVLNHFANGIGIDAVLVLRIAVVCGMLYIVDRYTPYIKSVTSILLFPIIWHLIGLGY